MLFVELDLHSVVEFYLGAARVLFDLYDLAVRVVFRYVCDDLRRDDPGRDGAVFAIDVGPFAFTVELDFIAGCE